MELTSIQEKEMSQSSSMMIEVETAPDPAKDQRIADAKAKERMWRTRMISMGLARERQW